MGSPDKRLRLAKDVVFYGIAGSGKTIQAEIIAKHFDAHLFCIGTTLRTLAQEDNDLGQLIKYHTERGTYPDDETHRQIYSTAVAEAKPGQMIVSEGVGRLPRLKKIFDEIEEGREQEYVVVHLVVSEDVAIRRIMQQQKRNDQNQETIRTRFQIYQENTLPVIDQHQKERPVLEVDAGLDLEVVTQNIIEALKPFTV